ncbi:MAG: hypothetical protein JWL82_454 [Parcubacteria group bacterium]|nr:hypothetical protein [Parcubacteria group bacterium]
MARILFAAYDAGPSRAFKNVMRELGNDQEAIDLTFDGKGDYTPERLARSVQAADVAIVGMSSLHNATLELAITDLMTATKKPVYLFADTFGAWRREWFSGVQRRVTGVFVTTEAERLAAKRLYRRVIVSGNPAWDEYAFPNAHARTKLGMTLSVQKVILISGTKKPELNRHMIEVTLTAGERLRRKYPYVAYVYAPHPGDRTDRSVYDSLGTDFNAPFRLLDDGVRADDVVDAISGLIHPGNSSLAVHCIIAHRGKIPIIDAPVDELDTYITTELGGWEYTLNSMGATYRPKNLDDLCGAIDAMSGGINDLPIEVPQDMIRFMPGQAARKILEVL